MPFKKYRLLNYEPEDFQALNANGWGYTLTVEVWSWWGLRKMITKVNKLLPYHMSAEKFWGEKLNKWITR